ncbi:TfoX/Sxy family protein [Culicoidibacter larvae]|uniref:TfoX/Sxy family protein n=1 Tax=Culicoidibacter larvae TaxID=2579976 RepID=A0A5R8QFI3_9FIRM|nr:TfoX/Sxy family protein [Culicoidibacter larvae]TLG76554.1 TfoX/Sxy family protein [Culicoidibacter larvae]
MNELMAMTNIGKVAATRLIDVGIDTPEKLIATGSMDAFLAVRLRDPGACLDMLYALEGAIEGVRWHSLPAVKKQELKSFFNSL